MDKLVIKCSIGQYMDSVSQLASIWTSCLSWPVYGHRVSVGQYMDIVSQLANIWTACLSWPVYGHHVSVGQYMDIVSQLASIWTSCLSWPIYGQRVSVGQYMDSWNIISTVKYNYNYTHWNIIWNILWNIIECAVLSFGISKDELEYPLEYFLWLIGLAIEMDGICLGMLQMQICTQLLLQGIENYICEIITIPFAMEIPLILIIYFQCCENWIVYAVTMQNLKYIFVPWLYLHRVTKTVLMFVDGQPITLMDSQALQYSVLIEALAVEWATLLPWIKNE